MVTANEIQAVAYVAMWRLKTFDPNQPRDANGKWGSGGTHEGLTSSLPTLKKRLAWMDSKNFDIVQAHIDQAAKVMSKDEFHEWAGKLYGSPFKKSDSVPKIRRVLRQHMEGLARMHSQLESIGPNVKPPHLLTGDE